MRKAAEPGSTPIKKARDERFALLLAEADGGLSLVEAWCRSDSAEVKDRKSVG